MSSIGVLEAKIKAAEIEIQNCKNAIKQINSISLSLSNVTSNLGCVANSLEKGIVINGKSIGVEPVNQRKNTIEKYNDDLNILKVDLYNRINELETSITGWRSEISRLKSEQKNKGGRTSYYSISNMKY